MTIIVFIAGIFLGAGIGATAVCVIAQILTEEQLPQQAKASDKHRNIIF